MNMCKAIVTRTSIHTRIHIIMNIMITSFHMRMIILIHTIIVMIIVTRMSFLKHMKTTATIILMHITMRIIMDTHTRMTTVIRMTTIIRLTMAMRTSIVTRIPTLTRMSIAEHRIFST